MKVVTPISPEATIDRLLSDNPKLHILSESHAALLRSFGVNFQPGATVDLIKLDLQGYELHALRGAKRVLSENPAIKLLLEFWPHGLESAGVGWRDLVGGWVHSDRGQCLISLGIHGDLLHAGHRSHISHKAVLPRDDRGDASEDGIHKSSEGDDILSRTGSEEFSHLCCGCGAHS